ncbi:MAG: AMP-binding protein, partial [Desulfovibrio sp.]|nr:AMP-binding protein [Desulfovibrio sp.]
KSIKICMSGSAPLPQEHFRRFQEITGATIVEGYGLTEASPVTHFTPLGLEGQRECSIGIPLPYTDARIVDMEAGSITLEPGKKGELVVRGPQVMKGYLNNPDETASALRNEWLYTGDIAIMDEDGFFYIVDRKKDMVIVGGFNVFPREVDEVLLEHPKIKEAVCVGLENKVRGEVLKAYIVPMPNATLSKTEVVAWCRDKLASYKVPRQIEFRDSLPRSIVGKILRRHLRDEEKAKQNTLA